MPGETVTVALDVVAREPVEDFVFGIGLFSAEGTSVYGTNTDLEGFVPRRLSGAAEVRLVLEGLSLVEGTYLRRRRRAPPRRHALRLPPRPALAAREEPAQGRGPLPPAAPLELQRGDRAHAPRAAARAQPRGGAGRLSLPAAIRGRRGRYPWMVNDTPSCGASPLPALLAERAAWRAAGQSVVLTNGCFDLLHPGHVALLEAARREGDRLVVALNADASVRRLKGEGRPIQPESERAELLLALEPVDRVVVYEEDTPLEVVRALLPDVLVKGADWAHDAIVGRAEVEAAGGRVVRVELLAGRSTSSIVERIRRP